MVLGTKLHEMLEFPTTIKFKVVGKNVPELLQLIEDALKTLDLNIIGESTFNKSPKGNWKSYHVKLNVADKEILEKIYVTLGEIPEVTMVI